MQSELASSSSAGLLFALQKAMLLLAQKDGNLALLSVCYKAMPLESSLLDSSACSILVGFYLRPHRFHSRQSPSIARGIRIFRIFIYTHIIKNISKHHLNSAMHHSDTPVNMSVTDL